MFAPGSIIVVTERPDVCYVVVKYNRGALKGRGWLLETVEGNTIIASMADHHYLARVVFITDKAALQAIYKEHLRDYLD
jgi:hypothetical protein